MPQLRSPNVEELPQVEWLSPRALRRNPANARTHSPKQIDQIAGSIRKFGFLNPVLIDDGNTILAGHGRWRAAQIDGYARIPVLRIGHLTAAQKRAFVIADNKIAEQAGWDRELLAIELGELVELLPAEGLDVTVTGFEVPEIDALLGDLSSPPPDPDETLPAFPTSPVTCRGDLWRLGKHRLLCGDAQDPRDFVRLLNGSAAAAVFCDPPYNVRVRTIGGRGRVRHRDFAFASGEMSPEQYRTFLRETLGNAIHASLAGAVHFICTDWRHVGDLIEVGSDLYETMLNLAVWNKTNAGQGSFYRSQHELIGIFRVAGHPHQNNVELGRFGRNRSNVRTYAGVNSFGRDRLKSLAAHPTVKPI